LDNKVFDYLHDLVSLSLFPVSAWLMAVLFPKMFSHTVGKPEYSYILSEMSHFYYLEETGTCGVLNKNFRVIESELPKLS